MVIPLEVSGADGVLSCRVSRTDAGWEGTVPMPRVLSVFPFAIGNRSLTAVRLEGILHLIDESADSPISDEEAVTLLRDAAEQVPDEAVGLLQWHRDSCFMRPLVLVRQSRTLVWETGCGSGSAAIGAWQALMQGDGITPTAVRQPGGTILVNAEVHCGSVRGITITGRVHLAPETVLDIT